MNTDVKTTSVRAPRREWTDSEIQSLREGYSNKGAKFVAEKLGRDIASVYQKATKLGLKSASRLSIKSITPEDAPKVRAYRRKSDLMRKTPVQKTSESIQEQKSLDTGKYLYNVVVDGNPPVKMFSDSAILAHSIIVLNIDHLRARCFVESVNQNSSNNFDLKVVQTSLAPTPELFELK